jgi:UDP-glucose 4-epimerase
MHVLITGGCGFIGSHLAHALVEAGHSVRILDNLSSGKRESAPKTAELIIGDIADTETVSNATKGVDGIFHLAAIASVNQCTNEWRTSHHTNMLGTVTVMEAAAKVNASPVPVVYASSAAVYGDSTELPLAEQAVTRPFSFYGLDKLNAELYAKLAGSAYELHTVGVRLFNVYGAGQNPNSPYSGVISRFVDAARTEHAVTIFGDGEQTRDFIFIADIVNLLQLALHHAKHTLYTILNGATGRATSLLQLLSTIEKVTGTAIERHFAPARTDDIRHSLGSPDYASKTIGFTASTTLEEGLRTMLPSASPLTGAVCIPA